MRSYIVMLLLFIQTAAAGANVTTNLKYNYLYSAGNWFELFIAPVGSIIGDLKFLVLGFVIFFMLYLKGQHTTIIATLGVIYAGIAISSVPPSTQPFAFLFIALAIAVILYRAAYRTEQ
jgi:hypothetical protein